MNAPSTTSRTDEDTTPAHHDEFAFCFSFFKKFGLHLSLSNVTLLSLERFLSREHIIADDPITNIHHRLVSMVTRRPVTADNWLYIISRMAYSARIINDMDAEYEEYSIKERLLLLKFLCELQFDRNQSFKHYLSKIPDNDRLWRDEPIGLDKEGKRYWILQDVDYDVRIYSEYKYLEYPFDHAQWNLLCRSTDQILQLINKLSNSTHINKDDDDYESQDEKCEDNKLITDKDGGKKRSHKRRKVQQPMEIIGCMVCGKDTLYSKMLLCDGCDKECHTFCQYPILWVVPDTEWYCPSCRQLKLIDNLSRLYQELVQGKVMHEQTIQDKQKKIKRLARGGVLVENIIQQEEEIEEEEAPRRSGRPRKKIDYAELNQLNIKILSPTHDITTRSMNASCNNTTVTRHARNTRRNRGYLMEDVTKNTSTVDKELHHEEEVMCSRVHVYDQTIVRNSNDNDQSLVCSVPLASMKCDDNTNSLISNDAKSVVISPSTDTPTTPTIPIAMPTVSLVTPSATPNIFPAGYEDTCNNNNSSDCYNEVHHCHSDLTVPVQSSNDDNIQRPFFCRDDMVQTFVNSTKGNVSE